MTHKLPPGPGPRDACNCGSLRKASRRMSQLYDLALAPSGLKCTQFAILAELDRAGPRAHLSVRELAAAMVMDRSTLGHNLRPLQRDRLLELRPAPDDRRKRCIELTKDGRITLRRARALWADAESRFEKLFGKRPAARLRTILHGIATHEKFESLPGGGHVDR